MLMTHYRQPIDFTVHSLIEAERTLDSWYRAVGDVEVSDVSCANVTEALFDDLNTSMAIAALHELRAEASKGSLGARRCLKQSAALLGLLECTESEWFAGKAENLDVDGVEVDASIKTRLAFIAARNWAEADRIRDELLTQGVQLKDGKDPQTGERITTWEVKR